MIAQKLCMREEIEYTHARVYTTYGIQRHVWNRRSIPRMNTGAEDVGNLNSSVRWERKSLYVLRRWGKGVWLTSANRKRSKYFRAFVRTVMNLNTSYDARNFLSISGIIGSWKRTVLNRVNERMFVPYAGELCRDGNFCIDFEDRPISQVRCRQYLPL